MNMSSVAYITSCLGLTQRLLYYIYQPHCLMYGRGMMFVLVRVRCRYPL